MSRIGHRTGRAGLGDAIDRAPQAAVVAEVDQRRTGTGQGADRVLGGTDACGVEASVLRVGGIAQGASTGQGAAVEVDGACVDDGVRAQRRGGECEVVVALQDGRTAVADLERSARQRRREGHRVACAGASVAGAEILVEPLVEVAGIDGEGEEIAADGLDGERTAIDGTVHVADRAWVGRAGCGGQPGAGLVGQPHPGRPVGRFVVAVVAHGGVEALPERVPDDRGGRIAARVAAGGLGGLDGLAAVEDDRHLPGQAGVARDVEPLDAVGGVGRVDEDALRRLAERGHHERRIDGREGETGDAEAGEAVVSRDSVERSLAEGPGRTAVGRAQDSFAVVGVGGVVGVSGSGHQDAVADAHRADAEGGDGAGSGVGVEDGQGVGQGHEADQGDWAGRVGRLPDAAAGGSEIDGVAGCVGGIDGDRGDSSGDVSVEV